MLVRQSSTLVWRQVFPTAIPSEPICIVIILYSVGGEHNYANGML